MASYTFSVTAYVTVEASSEKDACKELLSCVDLESDVPIGRGHIYIANVDDAELNDIFDEA